MEKLESQTLKSNGIRQEKPENQELFSYKASYRFICKNCLNKIHENIMLDFVEILPDNKLTCPLCLSLEIAEVKA